MAYYKKYAKIGRTTDRTLGFMTPTVSDELCPHFHKRFVRNGVGIPENRAICDKQSISTYCDYLKEVNGVPFCLRYWYGPLYEIVDLVRIPYVQKRGDKGALMYYEADGITETTAHTDHPVLLPVHEAYPLVYERDDWEKEQVVELLPGQTDPLPIYWDYQNGQQPKKTVIDTGFPVRKHGNMQFYSDQFQDTHEKRFRVDGNELGWHKNV